MWPSKWSTRLAMISITGPGFLSKIPARGSFDKGRIMIAICHNSDVGDAWEWADSPNYPEPATSMAYRIAINYIVYGMTH
ncbi:MAG: hypothetical protein DMG32_23450 [Acidobacteria bacterium]|nr:MAG: hypothetical protein DMG32_23450 [Acidobacteriota bacterium]